MEYYAQIFFQLLSEHTNPDAAWQSFIDVLAFEGVEPDRMEDIETYVLEEWAYTWSEE